jgi:hypothetical protein
LFGPATHAFGVGLCQSNASSFTLPLLDSETGFIARSGPGAAAHALARHAVPQVAIRHALNSDERGFNTIRGDLWPRRSERPRDWHLLELGFRKAQLARGPIREELGGAGATPVPSRWGAPCDRPREASQLARPWRQPRRTSSWRVARNAVGVQRRSGDVPANFVLIGLASVEPELSPKLSPKDLTRTAQARVPAVGAQFRAES